MRIALGCDHAAVAEKEAVAGIVRKLGHDAVDFGTHGTDSVDYPDFAVLVARAVASGEADLGILVCGTGIGMSMAANKVPGVRAAVVHSEYTARMAREHNDANVLCLGARVLESADFEPICRTFLEAEFAGGRHQRRVGKIDALDPS